MKLVITRNAGGRARLLPDPAMVKTLRFASNPGMEVTKIWATGALPQVGADEAAVMPGDPSFLPPPGETRLYVLRFPPDAVVLDPGFDLPAAIGEFSALMPEMAALRERDDPAMHRTDTVDYVTIIDGEVWLEVDDQAEVRLRAGDVVVQNGTRHAWRNRSDTCVTMVVVMVGARRSDSFRF